MKFIRFVLYLFIIPHYFLYLLSSLETKNLINSDIQEMNRRLKINKSLFYYLLVQKPYRNLFYYRITTNKNKIFVKFLKLFISEYPLFRITAKYIGPYAYVLNHPYATTINANTIGSNFTLCHLTTLGNKKHGRNDLVPTIGNNVSLGVNVTIIGDVKIGNNVVVGAGSVVVSDIPDNCVVVGNPAKIIRKVSE